MAQALNQLSDDDLLKMASQHGVAVPKPQAPQTGGLESMSDDDLIKLGALHGVTPDRQPGGLGTEALGDVVGRVSGGLFNKYVQPAAQKVAELNERYLAAPTRAGLATAIDESTTENSLTPAGRAKPIVGLLKGFAHQFGQDPEKSVSAEQLRNKIIPDAVLPDTRRISDFVPDMYSDSGDEWLKFQKKGILDPNLKEGLTTATGMLADVGNIIPFEKAPGLLARGLKEADIGGQLSKAGAAVGEKALNAQAKVASAFTGVPENIVKNYAKNGKAVDELIAKYGGNSAQAADSIREQYQTQLRNFKNKANEDISKALATKAEEITDVSPALQNLEKSKASLNPKTKAAERAQIQEHIDVLNSLADEEGNIALKDLFDAKEYLQDAGKSSYVKNGQLFTPGKDSARAAKNGARELRQILNKAAPDIAEANNKLALLHNAEDGLNKNLIKPGGPDAALMTAGAQPLSRQRNQLERLSQVSGVPMAKKAEDLATARAFANPELLPVDTTGKSPGRIAAGAGIGFLKGGPVGAAVGAAMTSPLALKYGIKTQRGLIDAAKTIAKPVGWLVDPANLEKAEGLLKSKGLLKAGKSFQNTVRKQSIKKSDDREE